MCSDRFKPKLSLEEELGSSDLSHRGTPKEYDEARTQIPS